MNHKTENTPYLSLLRLFVAALLFLLLLAGNLHAQATETMSVSALKNDIRYTEWRLKAIQKPQKSSPVVEPAAWQRAREDFLQLQIESGELQKIMGSGTGLDHRNVKDLINQIKKRAVRLKRSLLLPAPGEGNIKIKRESESLEVAVKTLDEAVIRFTGNPVFKHALILDLRGGERAANDLQTIIVLSKNIKKRVETAGQNK